VGEKLIKKAFRPYLAEKKCDKGGMIDYYEPDETAFIEIFAEKVGKQGGDA